MTGYSQTYAQDRAEIEDLMARYLFAMDWNDYDTYAETFTEDGVLDYAGGTTQGRENIRAEAKAFKEKVATMFVDFQGNPAVLRHVLCHSSIRVEGGRAWHIGSWFEMANDGPEGQPKLGTYGTYEDELVRVKGRWLFKRRKIYNEFLDGRHTGKENPVRAMDQAAEAARG